MVCRIIAIMTDIDTDVVAYYSARAGEYEEVYLKPERQNDLAVLREMVVEFAAGRRVLEVACGTGYWTQIIAESATSILAVDPSSESVDRARSKNLPADSVVFEVADALAVSHDLGDITAVVCGFLWSHIPRQEIRPWIARLVGGLPSGIPFLFMDNRYVEASSTPIAEVDTRGNTYQLRRLSDGQIFRIIKNFPSSVELRRAVEDVARGVGITDLEYYWLLQFTSR